MVDPVGTQSSSNDDDCTEPKDDHEADTLSTRKLDLPQCWHGQRIDDEVCCNGDDDLSHERRALALAVALWSKQVPIATGGSSKQSMAVQAMIVCVDSHALSPQDDEKHDHGGVHKCQRCVDGIAKFRSHWCDT